MQPNADMVPYKVLLNSSRTAVITVEEDEREAKVTFL
jgi:hypothetical protein